MSDRFTTWWALGAPAGQHAASPGWSRWGPSSSITVPSPKACRGTRPPLRASACGRSATPVAAYGRGRRTGSTALVGKVQPLGGAVHLRIFLVCVIYRCLVFSDDHLDPPKVCHARCGSRMLAGGYSPLASLKRPDTPTSMNRKQGKFGESTFHALGE